MNLEELFPEDGSAGSDVPASLGCSGDILLAGHGVNFWVPSRRRQHQFGKWATFWYKGFPAFSLRENPAWEDTRQNFPRSLVSLQPMAWIFCSCFAHVTWCHRVETTEVLEGGGLERGRGAEMKSGGPVSGGFIGSLNAGCHSSTPWSSELEGTSKSPSHLSHIGQHSFPLTPCLIETKMCHQEVSIAPKPLGAGLQVLRFPEVRDLLHPRPRFCRCFLCWLWLCSVLLR